MSNPAVAPVGPTMPVIEEFFVNPNDQYVDYEAEEVGEDANMEDAEEDEMEDNMIPPEVIEVDDLDNPFKRSTTSGVWKELCKPVLIKKKWKVKCKFCPTYLSILKSGSTTHLKRHLDRCSSKKAHLIQQSLMNFMPANASNKAGFVSAIHDGQLDMVKMREGIAHWLTMHDHPFTVVEEEGFNLMMKRGLPEWRSVSRGTIRTDCFNVYDFEKKKLMALFKKIDRISLTTDLWRSKHQRIEYMVLTAHFVDRDWKLQKRVINFVHLPPPRKGANIADCILTCLREWEIQDKVFTISVDNASANGSCIKVLKANFASTKRLICEGKLFHVRCCAHILNIMVQQGLEEVKNITDNVHKSIDYLNASEGRLQKFRELVGQYDMQE